MKILMMMIGLAVSGNVLAANDVDRLQEALQNLKTIQTDFAQTIFSSRFGDEHAKGEMIIVKPDKMSWVYSQPTPRIFLADGKMFYRFDASDKVEHTSDQQELMKEPSSFFFLWKNVELSAYFDVSAETQTKNMALYTLIPKDKQSDLKKIQMKVSFAPFSIHQLETWDQLNQKNRFVFDHVKINKKVASKTFDYDVQKKALEKK